MMVVNLLLVLNFSIDVSASSGCAKQEANVCITISQRLSVKGGSGTVNPKDVRYMQSSIKNQTGNYTVLDNAQALKDDTLKPGDLPEICIWKDNDGNLWTLDYDHIT